MIRIAICDDERNACIILKKKIVSLMASLKEDCEVKCYFGAAELLAETCTFDLFFLDIQMPERDGIALAKKMRESEKRSIIVFVTALPERVYDAFEVEAFDYICKPVDNSRLLKTMDRAIRKLREGKSLFIQVMGGGKSVRIDDIHYCEVINRKIYLHTESEVIDYYAKLDDVEKQLDYRFIRCHRSYLVNLDYLSEYAGGAITLVDGGRIPVSRLRHQDIMGAILSYMKAKG